jgi:transcriptional regulator with XRE-family HTH domain
MWDREAFKSRLALALRRAGKSAATASADAGYRDASAVSQWTRGLSRPPLPRVAELARALGVTPGWLAFGDGLDPDAEAHLHLWRRLSARQRALLTALMRELSPVAVDATTRTLLDRADDVSRSHSTRSRATPSAGPQSDPADDHGGLA